MHAARALLLAASVFTCVIHDTNRSITTVLSVAMNNSSIKLLFAPSSRMERSVQGGSKNGATLFCRNTAQICTIFAEIKVV